MSGSVPGAAAPRRPSPLGGRRPRREELAAFATDDPHAVDDVLPVAGRLRLLIVGINPGLWTAAVNAPFAHPGNRFWPSLHRAGLTDHRIEAAAGLDPADADALCARGIGITNILGRATVRAAELTAAELRAGAADLITRVSALRPHSVAIAGITAYRTAFQHPQAALGRQDTAAIDGWPADVSLWVLPQPSGLNAHETIDSLAARWAEMWAAAEA